MSIRWALTTTFIFCCATSPTGMPKGTSPSSAPLNYSELVPATAHAVRAYVQRAAKEVGVNPVQADWIVRHESHYGRNIRGDAGRSRGYWMISSVHHPEVSTACADDLRCSTDWSLRRLRDGFANEWTTWRFRCEWYGDAPECPH